MKGQRWIPMLMAAIMLLSFAGCGGDVAPESSAPDTSDSASAESSTSAASGEESGATGQTDSTTGAKNPTQGGKVTTTTTRTPPKTNGTGKVTVGNDVTIATGTKPSQTETINYKGAKFKLAIPYDAGAAFQRKMNAFGAKYNCDIAMSRLTWGQYNTQLSQAVLASKPYDIVFTSGSFYPAPIVADLLLPVDSAITTADLVDAKAPEKGGINLELSKAFAWGNQLYALSSNRSVYPEVMYYNKKLFREAGLEDPYTLYKNGKWNWQKFMEQADLATDTAGGVYYMSYPDPNALQGLFDTSAVKLDENGAPYENLSDSKMVAAFNFFKDSFVKPGKIIWQNTDPATAFKNGTAYIYTSVTDGYAQAAGMAKDSTAFDKNISNLGVVPWPLPAENTRKAYPVHQPQGWAINKGSKNVDVLVEWVKFESTFNDPVQDENILPSEYRAVFDKLMTGNVSYPISGFTDSSNKTIENYISAMAIEIRTKNADVAAQLTSTKPLVQKCIDDAKGK